MGGQGGPAVPYGTPSQTITIDQAVGLAQKYAASQGNPDIVLTEVEEYANNFYTLYKEKKTSIHAFEMLIDKYNGRIYPEPGPNQMWNTKYSPAAPTMGTGGPVTPMLMTVEQAQSFAQSFLSAQLPGVTYGDANAFYGYYTVEIKRGGKTLGMLSVNGYSGQVWYHNWHGDFIQEKEVNG